VAIELVDGPFDPWARLAAAQAALGKTPSSQA